MLLIVNFDQSQPLLRLAQQIAGELGESYEQTYVISVGMVETETNLEILPALAPVPPTNLYSALAKGTLQACNWLSPVTGNTGPANYNRLAEKLLYLAGLLQPHHYHKEHDEDSDVESNWHWDEEGPIVIIPPQDNPALALFLGHALVHYSEEAEKWAGLYVVTGYRPLQIQEWD